MTTLTGPTWPPVGPCPASGDGEHLLGHRPDLSPDGVGPCALCDQAGPAFSLEEPAGQTGGGSTDAERTQELAGYPQAVDGSVDGDAKRETGDIPKALRERVLARDTGHCRVCGAVPESPAVHHIVYRSSGGLNVLENLVTVHWMFAPRCHEVVHANKGLWTPALQAVVDRPGITALQWLRWRKVQLRRVTRGGS